MTDIDPVDIPNDPQEDPQTGLLILSDTAYNYLKALVTLILPAISTMYVAVAGIWDFNNVDKVVGTLVAITTFLGVMLRISTRRYNKSEAKYAGAINVITQEDGRVVADMVLNTPDPQAVLAAGNDMTFKVNPVLSE